MRDKLIFLRFLSLLLILLTLAAPLSVHAEQAPAERAEALYEGILAHQLKAAGAGDVQEWIDGALTEGAGDVAEYYIIALARCGEEYDFSSYRRALAAAIEAKGASKDASGMLKLALANLAVGGDGGTTSALLDRYAGEMGVMSWVFALHLLNNGVESEKHTADSVIDRLLSLRLSDGGWALTGQYSDADITAMTVQALAPSYDRREDVKEAVDEAVTKLASMQLADGGFQSYGMSNPESGAQVLIALACLGIDGLADERFIKEGGILDGIARFRLEDGSFRHLADGGYSAMATQQVFSSMTAYRLQTPFYIFGAGEKQTVTETAADTQAQTMSETEEAETTAAESEAEARGSAGGEEGSPKLSSPKLIICAVIAAGALILCVIFFALKRRNPKNFIIILLAAAVVILLVNSLDISLPEQYYGGVGDKENVIGRVTLSISCERLVELGEVSEHIPADGMLLEACEFDLAEGESAYDITVEAARKFGIHIDAETANGYEMAYMKGIGYLYELDYGAMSGWIYRINGEDCSVGCGEYKLKDGDVIEWIYTLELGNDLK